ncbi:glycosyltransferase family 4 protein [Tenacibaculum sp.]|uniref:glycosyltransferase family 4 protein n=1 Tax=Tenacibaculum sp. TaxID=1906242 RepID=UPI003AA86809
MKIVKFIPSFYGGGGESLAVTLANSLVEQGDEVLIVSVNGSEKKDSKYKKIIKKLDPKVKVIFLEKEHGVFVFLKNLLILIQYLIKNKYEVFHSHLSGIYLYLFLFFFFNVKKIHTIHSLPDVEARGKIKFIYQLLNRIGVEFVAISSELKIKSDIYFGFATKKVVNGVAEVKASVNKNSFYNELSIPECDLVIVQIGRLYFEKNQIFTINNFENLFSLFNGNISLVIIGEDPTNEQVYYKLIDEKYNALPSEVKSKIHFLGYKENVHDYFSISDLLLITSKYEGLPLVILEAAQHSLPVITTDVGGVREIVNDDNSYIYQVDDKRSFLSIFSEIKKNPSTLSIKGSLLHELYISSFTDTKMAEQYKALYSEKE